MLENTNLIIFFQAYSRYEQWMNEIGGNVYFYIRTFIVLLSPS